MEFVGAGPGSLLDYARLACDTLMRKYPAADLPPKGHFHYHQGVFLSGMYQTYFLSGDDKYYNYIKDWVDSLVDQYGNISGFNPGMMDDMQPGVLLFPLYERTGDSRYRGAMDTIAHYLRTCPANPDGGFWHKAWYRNQMWLDGLYMGGPFAAMYGAAFGRTEFFDIVCGQAGIMEAKTRDERTGLWRHAWDYERRQPWADKETGRSPEFWGRSMGWVPIALLEEAGHLPDDHPGRAAIIRMARELLRALLPYQDAESGLWYQVVDKPGAPGNWVETSCTCLYAAAICKAVRMGVLGGDCMEAARRGAEGVIRRLGYDDDGVLIGNVCVGTGVGDYAHYIARPTSVNDLHGVGAFLMMCAEGHRRL